MLALWCVHGTEQRKKWSNETILPFHFIFVIVEKGHGSTSIAWHSATQSVGRPFLIRLYWIGAI